MDYSILREEVAKLIPERIKTGEFLQKSYRPPADAYDHKVQLRQIAKGSPLVWVFHRRHASRLRFWRSGSKL